jgi:hypothetical protein
MLWRQVETLGMAGRLDRLSHSARLVLYCMAMNAHDKGTDTTPRAIYFRGWEHLAHAALGREEYDESAERMVARAVAECVATGYVKPVGRRHDSRHGAALYQLMV